MGTQNRYARMPLPPANVAPHVRPRTRGLARIIASGHRDIRAEISGMSGSELVRMLDAYRPAVADNYPAAMIYRAGLHEAVVVRHWTVTWSALVNAHEIH